MMTREETRALDKFWKQVDIELRNVYGTTWADVCGDTEPLLSAIEGGETPQQFVEWFAEKYDLQTLEEQGIDECSPAIPFERQERDVPVGRTPALGERKLVL